MEEGDYYKNENYRKFFFLLAKICLSLLENTDSNRFKLSNQNSGRQKSTISATLFNVMINDLPDYIDRRINSPICRKWDILKEKL